MRVPFLLYYLIDIELPELLRPMHNDNLIRVGSDNDGGYILPKQLVTECDFLLSFGLNINWTFEEDFTNKNKVPIHCYDHTVNKESFERRKIMKKYQEYEKFFDGVDNIHFKEEVNLSSIDKIFSRVNADKIFLKMDIEGEEYNVLQKILEYRNITGMVVEFHRYDQRKEDLLKIVSQIQHQFNIVHIHVNNGALRFGKEPRAIEITFENKKLSENPVHFKHDYPIAELDKPNNPNLDDFKLSFS